MEILTEALAFLRLLIPSGITLIAIIIIMFIARYLLKRGETAISVGSFRRQSIMLILSFIGLIVMILVLPMADNKRGQLLSLIGILITAAIALSS